MKNNTRIFFKLVLVALPLFAAQNQYQVKPAQIAATSTDPLGVVKDFLTTGLEKAEMQIDTLRILALRAEFVEDNLATTTGNGRFQYIDDGEYVINKPPHNRTYFQQQLKALNHYFKTVSDEHLVIVGDVYPQGEEAAYQLSQNMVYYSGEEDEERQKQRWAELLRDVVNLAAEQDAPDFSAYDAFVVFHAGVGADISFDFDTSPFDIQSAFIDLTTLQETIGNNDSDYQGIPAGDTFIQEGMIWPETLCQEGIDFGMLGLMTLLTGSQIGMPALYNTETGAAGVGSWGMMDQGSFNYFGLVPAEPCAWTKIYMGWEKPVVVSNAQNLQIGSPDSKYAPHIYKIPINASEYFLVENRQEDRNGDGLTYGRDDQGKRIAFDSTKYELSLEAGLGVITQIFEYDFGLPGSGLLIWHVDDDVIRENLATQTINNNPEHPGIDLIECDGPQDIGRIYGQFTAGSGTENGDYWDPYWASNFSHQYVNAGPDLLEELGVQLPISLRDEQLISAAVPVTLSPNSIPTSDAFGGAVTHITFSDFSEKDSVMIFSVSNTFSIPNQSNIQNFPAYVGDGVVRGGLMAVNEGVVVVRTNGDVLALKTTGSSLFQNNVTKTVSHYNGNKTFPYAIAAKIELQPGEIVLDAPVALDVNGDGTTELAIASTKKLYVFSLQDLDGDKMADLLYSREGEFSSNIVAFQNPATLYIGTKNGELSAFTWNLTRFEHASAIVTDRSIIEIFKYNKLLLKTDSNRIIVTNANFKDLQSNEIIHDGESGLDAAIADFDGNGTQNALFFGSVYDIAPFTAVYDGEDLDVFHSFLNLSSISRPAIIDADMNGLLDIISVNAEQLLAFNYKAEITTNFPVTLQGESSDSLLFTPLAWQTDEHSYLLAAHGKFIDLIDDKANPVIGFPLSAGAEIITDPVIYSAANNMNLFAINSNGFLHGWHLDFSNIRNAWLCYGGSNLRGFQSPLLNSQYIPKGNDVMPDKQVFCYPNPVYDGVVYIRYSLNRSVDAVSIRIYDIAGSLVTTLVGDENIGDHDVAWQVNGIASGSYLARVESRVGSESYVKFIKIAVVK